MSPYLHCALIKCQPIQHDWSVCGEFCSRTRKLFNYWFIQYIMIIQNLCFLLSQHYHNLFLILQIIKIYYVNYQIVRLVFHFFEVKILNLFLKQYLIQTFLLGIALTLLQMILFFLIRTRILKVIFFQIKIYLNTILIHFSFYRAINS
jgi:hypothetical protein